MCRHSWPYTAGPSAWGESTTKQEQFCEMHYYMSPYVAEFISTLSNLAYIYAAAWGVAKMKASRHDESIFWSYISLAAVGLGSIAFHATVTYVGQLADEIAMLYATATIAYAAYSIDRDSKSRLGLVILLSSLVAAITAIHVYRGESTVFQVSWASMVVAVFVQCRRLLRSHVSTGPVSKQMSMLVRWGTVSFLTGFLLWNIDNLMCDWLLALRAQIGMPWGFVTELHGWWHVLTALGVYYFIVFIHYLRLYITDPAVRHTKTDNNSRLISKAKYELCWPGYSILPYLVVSTQQGQKS